MPRIEENRSVWTREWNWSERGDEWSTWWGGTEAMWHGVLLPRLHAHLPAGTILEIAPGFGRWTQFLKDQCDHLVLVDLAENCIEHCQQRFASSEHIEYHVNDGRSLEMVADSSIDLAFSFDSLVHAEMDVLEAYLQQLADKLSPDGIGFLHHSNAGALRALNSLARRTPRSIMEPLVTRGVLPDLAAWRAETVTAEAFADACSRAGLSCVSQEKIRWERGFYLLDTLSTFTRRGSAWDRPRAVMRNPLFRLEATRMSRLYSRVGFDRSASPGSS